MDPGRAGLNQRSGMICGLMKHLPALPTALATLPSDSPHSTPMSRFLELYNERFIVWEQSYFH